MKYLQIKGWKSMQQYKDRDPKWIKLDRELLDNYEFTQLSDAYKFHVIGIRLLVAKIGNKIPYNPEWIRARISATEQINLQVLITAGFIEEFDGKEICVRDCTKLYTEKSREEKSREEKIVNEPAFTLQQVEDEGFKAGISDGECKIFFDHYCSQGWLKGNGLPITNLASQLANWRNNGHKFPDKPKPPPDLKKSQHDQWESQCGEWLRKTTEEMIIGHPSFSQRLKNPDFRTWAESVNVIVKEI